MKRLILHIAVAAGALLLLLGIPAVAFGVPQALLAPDAVSGATMDLPDQPGGNFVVLLNTALHPGTAEDWTVFFAGGETDVIMDDVACMSAQGDAAGLQLAERFQARLAEHQMEIRQVNPTLLASRAEEGVFDTVILSAEMAEALRLRLDNCPETAVIAIEGETP